MGNYNIRMFRNSLSSYIKQSPIEPEVKLLVLRDLTAQAEKDADEMVVREASELKRLNSSRKMPLIRQQRRKKARYKLWQ